MRLNILAFLLGILSCHTLSDLPDNRWVFLAFPSLALLWILPHLRYVLFYTLGFLWLVWRANLILAHDLNPVLEGQDVTVVGTIDSLPVARDDAWQFDFTPTQLLSAGRTWPPPARLRLFWSQPKPVLQPSQHWQFSVHLKRPHTLLNPHTFDYSSVLFQQRIRATGYVRDGTLLQPASPLSIDAWRDRLANAIHTTLGNHPHAGVVVALAVGHQRAISPDQWEIWRLTGTIHLISISGLHLSLIALLVFWIVRWLWGGTGNGVSWLPAQRVAAWAGLGAAVAYALLAGFSIPTQRSLIMISVAFSNILLARSVAVSHLLAFALFLVLLYDPLAVMSMGFWLSFGAIAVIIYVTTGRRMQKSRLTRWGLSFARTQWAVTLGLLPILLTTFGYLSLIPPLANVIAVPWISFIITPLILLGTLLILPYPDSGHVILEIAAQLLDSLWTLLTGLANLQWVWYVPIPPLWTMIVAMVGIMILLSPRGFPARWLGLIYCLPLFVTAPEQPRSGELWLTVLDVGQGLAVVARTRNHLLVYDTGPSRSDGFNTGTSVVVPFLQAQGLRQIDTLLISHDDNDHSGGAESVLKALAVTTVMTSAPAKFMQYPVESCYAGQRWQWDGVDFQILHPQRRYTDDNQNSCVLKISIADKAVLLTGDIDNRVERDLVETRKTDLAATVLIVAHHGSKNSSMPIFIDAVHPEIAIISAGYRNRYRHPHAETIRRYTIRHIRLLETATTGTIYLQLAATGMSELWLAREHLQRYWHFAGQY